LGGTVPGVDTPTRSKSVKRDAPPAIPRYTLYGETSPATEDWFANVELLADRCRQRGWKIAPHSHDRFGQLVYVRSGRGLFIVDDRVIPFESPCVLLAPINAVHGFSYEDDTDGWVVTVAEYYLRHLAERAAPFSSLWAAPAVFALPRDGDDAGELRDAICKLERELEQRAPSYRIAAEIQISSIFLTLTRLLAGAGPDIEDLRSNQARIVEDYRQLLERHYQHGWKIGRFASELGLSLAQLRAACDAVAGKGPSKMLQARLLSEAKRNLLFTDMTVEQIAYWLGFSDPAYFARFFRKEAGQPPAAFRRAMRRSELDQIESA
jgi:AraC family transcriptional regulator, transcriptional activator of pobA